MKTLIASLFAACFALGALVVHAAPQLNAGVILADEESSDGDKAPKTDKVMKDEDDDKEKPGKKSD